MTAPISETGTTIDNSTTAPVEVATAPAFANKADTEAQLAQAKEVEAAVAEVRNDDLSKKDGYNPIFHAGFEADKALRAAAHDDNVDMHVENQRLADMKRAALATGIPMGVQALAPVGKSATPDMVGKPAEVKVAKVEGNKDEKTIALGGKPEGHADTKQ
jgi:hypothetical protein